MHTRVQRIISFSLALVVTGSLLALDGCASRMAKQEEEEQQEASQRQAPVAVQTGRPETAAPAENPRNTVLGMNARLDALEAKMSAMNDKLDATRAALDNFLTAHQPKATGVPSSPAETVGIPASSAPVAGEHEAGYINDAAIQLYRKAEVLLESQKNSDAILTFSNFLEKYPDHPLAGSAQFHIGEAYFKQKQYRQADQEFQKVLTSYDRSPHVSDTLRYMAAAEEAIGKTEEAARHRQQLSSLFANSPAAAAPALTVSSASETTSAPMPQHAAPAPARPPGEKPSLDEVPPSTPVTAPTGDANPSMEKSGGE